MRWRGERESDNVEDRRGMAVSRGVKIGGISGLGLVVVVVISMVAGVDPTQILQQVSTTQVSTVPGGQQTGTPPVNDDMRKFVAVVLGETEDVWRAAFQQMGTTYQLPRLVLFSGAVDSACGMAGSATGPFYCPGDQKVYLDLSFFDELQSRFGVSGDFAQAYVIAHEVGHHVQHLMGIMEKVEEVRARSTKTAKNQLSVMLELQADCLAGVWAKQADKNRHILEAGDIEEGLNAASAIGDDRIQKMSQGYVVPDAFTHGSAAQRVRWFKAGLEGGAIGSCNTFEAGQL
jgi:predicted metalloprotease